MDKLREENRRLRELVETTAKLSAFERRVYDTCTIPDGQVKRKAREWAEKHWRDEIPVKYTDLFELD